MDIFTSDYIAINERKRSYAFFTSPELFAMARVGGNFISTTRRAELLTHHKICTEQTCGSEAVPGLGDFYVHTLDETTFVVKTRHPVSATLVCNIGTSKTIELNLTALLTVPPECSIESDYFRIYESSPAKSALPEMKTEFAIHPQQLSFKTLSSNSSNVTNSHSSWRAIINANKFDLLKLGNTSAELKRHNDEFKEKVSTIETAYNWMKNGFWSLASGGGAITLIIIVAALCLCICACRNRDTLSLCCM